MPPLFQFSCIGSDSGSNSHRRASRTVRARHPNRRGRRRWRGSTSWRRIRARHC